MTGTQEKIRSIFLTAIMVMSVIAMTASFAGTAAAQAAQNETSVNVNSQTINPDTLSITVESAELNNTDIEEIAVWTLDNNNEPNTKIGALQANQGQTAGPISVPLGNVDEGYDELTGGAQRLAVTVNGEVANDWEAYDTARFVNPHDKLDIEDTFETQWQGQHVWTDTISSDQNLELYEGVPTNQDEDANPSYIRDLSLDDNGIVRVNTGTLSDGQQYFISNDGGETSIGENAAETSQDTEFRVRAQTLEATIGDENQDVDDVSVSGDGTTTELFLQSNRGGSHVVMQQDDLDADEIAELLPEGMVEGHLHPSHSEHNASADYWANEDDGYVVLWDVPPEFDVLLDFDGQDEQEYTFSFTPSDTGVLASDTVNAADPDGALQWTEPFQTQAQGDIANFTLEMEDTNDAWVLFGSPDVNYMRLLNVQDDDNDGEVSFELNTWLAGQEDPGDAVSDGVFTSEDDIIEDRTTNTIQDEFEDLGVNNTLNRSIDTTDDHPEAVYDIGAALTNDYAVDQSGNELVLADEQAFHELNLVEGSLDDVTIHAAPSARADSYDEAWEALEAATPTTDIAFRDQYIVEFEASGIYGVIDDEDALSEFENITLSFTQMDPGPNRDPIEIDFSEEVEAGAVYPDQENGTLVAVLDSRNAQGTNTDSNLNVPELEAGQTFNATLDVDTSTQSGLLYDNFTVVERHAEFEGLNDAGQFLFAPTENESVAATTTVAPGSNVRVRARQPGHIGDEFTLRFTETEVVPNEDDNASHVGRINTTLDLSGISAGAEFETSIRSDTRVSDTVQSFIGEIPDASVDVGDVDSDGPVGTITVDSVNLNRGGFIAIHEGAADGPIIGVSEKLEAGGHTDVQVRLDEDITEETEIFAMPHQDDSNEGTFDYPDNDPPYTDDDGNPVTGSATVSVSEDTPTPTPTDTPDDPETPTPTDTPDTPDTPDDGDTDDEGPGFGVVVALLALISAGMLARRRA